MKNFTNNFKQFTSRLSARWLIMALMMLVGTSSAWAATYLSGEFNSWNASDPKYQFSNGTLNVSMNPGTYQFKVVEDGKWYSMNNTNITKTVSSGITMYENNNNNKITITYTGVYTFIWDGTNNKLKVTYPDPPVSKTYTGTIKFKRPSAWTKVPHIHIFYDGSNTLVDNKTMTLEGVDASGNTWYKYDYSITTTFTTATIMFNNGGWGNGQTNEQFKGNLGTDYCLTGGSSADVTSVDCPVYCTPPAVPTLSADKTDLVAPNKATLTVGNTTSGLTYKLYNSTNEVASKTSTGSDLTFEVDDAGNYTVSVTNDCGSTSTSTPAVVITVCTPQTNEFRHANSSYTQLQDQPTYYPGDKAYFVSTINCCLTGTWSANLQKGEEAWWTGLSGSTPKFSMTLTRAGNFTITNMATNGCTQDKNVLVNLDFTVTALSEVTNANGTASGADIALTWKHSTNHTKVMVVRYPTAGTETIPAGGQAYTEGNTLGGGTVVYVGTAESCTDKNLPAGVSYKYYFYTVNNNYYSEGVVLNMSSCPTPAKPQLTSSAVTTCNGNVTTLGYITITNMTDYKDDTYTFKLGDRTANPDANGKIVISSADNTEYTVTVTNSCGNQNSANVDIAINNITPTISGATFTQPGKDNAIELTVPTGNDTKWTVNNNGDLSVATGSSTMFSAENKDTYTITADYNGCTDTHDVTVDDAFYVYFRAPKEGEETTQSKDAWYQFYYPNENSEQYRGGAMYYGESDAMPTSATLQNFNKGGKTAEIIFTDCDDYTWYGFKASAEVIAGTKYFYVHATNDKGLNGCHTHTKPQKLALTGDIYYTLGDNGSCYDGWAVNKVLAPYAGPKVHASGSTALGTNKFAALYVTDCSGKEIDTYQWESCGTQAGTYANYKASVTNSGTLYSGDAGETNNIRPSVAGYYRCKVTYKDGSTVTSEPVQVTGSYTHASSTLPVIIVNTNGKGFPVNNTCQTPSAHADEMKAKRSVDVKIYQGNTMVYDRKARMNYRGSSSLNFLKKSYAFCPGKDNCVEDKGRLDYVKTEKMNMLGIGEASDKDWVLYAAAADPSLMRNRLMFDTFRDMTGGWSVNSRYVELYVDGVYKGVYVMMDKITNNKKRVNITASNGFIVKFDKTDLVDRYEADGDKKTFKSLYSGYDGESGNGMLTYDTYIDQRFEIEYPEMEDVEEDNPGMWAKTVNDIKTLFNNFESNLKAGNYAEVQKIIDYISWADWFIISEYAKNMDAYRASCLFVYNGGKIEARPLWDQELSFNNQCANLCATYGCNNTTGLLIENSEIYEEGCSAPFWFTGKYVGGRGTEAKSGAQFEGYLLNDPCFIAVLKERWALHTATGGALTQDVMNAKISGYEKDLGSVGTSGTPLYRERNTFWSGKSRKTIDKANSGGTCFTGETGYQDTEISTSISAMKSWITGNRRTNLGTLINKMEGSPLSISFEPQQVTTTPWEPITLQVINTSSYDYTITYTDGELDKQSGVIINKTDDTFKINVPRPWPAGNEEVEGERADITYGIKATLNVADGTTVCGKSEVTPATATIILQDEPNEICPQP